MYEDRGTPIAVRQVVQALLELGHGVDILTYPVGRTFPVSGVRLIRVANPLGIRRVRIGLSWQKLVLDAVLTSQLGRVLRRRYDWIHAVEEAAFPAVVFGRLRGIPVLYDMQSSLAEQLGQYRLGRWRLAQRGLCGAERWLLRRATHIVASHGLAGRVRRAAPSTPFGEWPYPSVAPYVDETEARALRAQMGVADEDILFLYLGSFEPYQGLPLLVDAAAEVLKDEPRSRFLLVGGEGEAAEQLQQQIRRHGIEGRVSVLPRTKREGAWTYLAIAHVAVSARCYGDNLPLKILDYMAMGKPILATRIPAHTSVLDETCAELVAANAGGLADGMLRLLRNPRRAASIGAAAARLAQERFGWSRFVDFVSDTVEAVCAAGPRRGLHGEPTAKELAGV